MDEIDTREFSLEITYRKYSKSNSRKRLLKYTIYKGYNEKFFTSSNKEALRIEMDLLGVSVGNSFGYTMDRWSNKFESKIFWLWNKS